MDAQSLTPEQAQTLLASLTPESLGALIAALGISADQVTPETILAAVQALGEKGAQVDTLTAEIGTLKAQLAQLQDAETERQNQALTTELAGYDIGDTEVAALRGLPPDSRAALLAKMPKKQDASSSSSSSSSSEGGSSSGTVGNPPPAPVHDPKGQAAADTPEARAAAAEKLIREVQAEGKFKSYEAARAEARRRQPALFS